MRERISFKFAFVLLAGLLLSGSAAHAQGVGTSGTIIGTVTDPAGAAVPGGTVSADDPSRGIHFSSTTDSNGQYRIPNLPPGSYDVAVQMHGFQSQVQKGVAVSVGEIRIADFHLTIASTATEVVVNTEPAVIETQRGSQSNTLTEQYIENLPIDRRDYLTFTLLLPGVSDSTRLADDQDFRVKQTPQSGLSFYGSNGRGNSITVDGGEAQDDAGGVRPTVSQDAVQEFQVNRSNYTAELGGASGATVNIVTKTGTNNVHGALFTFVRNDGMDARDPFAFSQALAPGQVFNPLDPDLSGQPIKNSLQRYQFGGNVGFPIKKDKTFLFIAFEGLRQDSENAVPLLTNTNIFRPTPSQQAGIQAVANEGSNIVPCLSGPVGTVVAQQLGLPAPNPTTNVPGSTCAAILTGTLTVNPATSATNAFLVNQFEDNGGLFPYTSRNYLASVRLDHRISEADQVSFIYHYDHDLEENPDVESLTGYSAGSSIHTYDNTIQGTWLHVFSPRTLNELRIQWDYDSFDVIPNEPGEVGLQISGYANNLGTNIFLPNRTILRRLEAADNFTLIRGNHTIKFGGSELLRGNHAESHTFLPGRFVFGTLPGDLLTPQLPSLTSMQSASFGLPQVFQQGFGNPDYPAYTRPLTGLYLQDSWRITSNFTLNYGARYEIDSQFQPLNTYYRDIGPRVSFAWDPFRDHKTVIRGGYGIFFGPIDAQIPQVDLSLGVLNKNHSTVENQRNTSQVPDQVNNAVNTCGISFAGTAIFPGTNTSPCTRYISIYVDPINPSGLPIATAPTVFQTLFAAGPNGGLIGCTTPPPGSLACITPQSLGPMAAGGLFPNPLGSGIFPANGGPLSPLTVLFSNPPNYKPPYSQQASLGIQREIASGFSVSVNGIYVHTLRLPVAIDTNLQPSTPMSTITLANGKSVSYRNWNGSALTDPVAGLETSGPGFGGVYPCAVTLNGFGQPVSPCFVNPLVVQNNQYTSAASALYEGLILEAQKRFSNYFSLFGNYTFSKGFDTSTDYNTDYGPQDPTDLSLDRGLSEFDERHKVVVAGVFDSPWKQSFLSGFQLAPIFSYHSGHPFNLLAGGEVNGNNHTTNERPIGAPRDTGLGPNYIDFDMRLGWTHKLGEKFSLQLTAEGFNIANRTNYASVNNEVGPVFGLEPGFTTFNVHGVVPNFTSVTPGTPLSFTSALPKREIQLGARLTF